jgi:hypothetical protein
MKWGLPGPGHGTCDRAVTLIESLALAIAQELKQMPLPDTMGAPVFGGADVTKFIQAYESLSSRTGTDPAAADFVVTFLYDCSDTIRETIKMTNGYLTNDRVQLKDEL